MLAYLKLFVQQTKTLLWKNYLLAKRSWKLSLVRLLLPSVFVIGFFLIFHYSTRSSSEDTSYSIGNVMPCVAYSASSCMAIAYYPDSPVTRAIMQSIADFNEPKLQLGKDIKPIQDFISIDQFRYDAIFNFPNTTQTAVIFNSTVAPYNYTIVYNDSIQTAENILAFSFLDYIEFVHPLQRAVDSAIVRVATKSTSFVQQITYEFFPDLDSSFFGNDGAIKILVGSMALAFFYLGLTATLVMGMNAIVTEKERNIRGYMRSFGMMDGPFWVSWFLEMVTFYVASVLIMMAFGYAFPGLQIFRNANFFATFFTLLVYGIELICLCFVLSSLISRTRAANIVSFLIYFFGLGIVIPSCFLGNNLFYLYSPSVIKEDGNWFGGLSFLPVVMFTGAVINLQTKAVGDMQEFSAGDGFHWSDMYEHPDRFNYAPTVNFNIWVMIAYSTAYAILAWYLDNVISDTFGARRQFYFPFQPSYWGYNKKAPYQHDFTAHLNPNANHVQDEDLRREQTHVPDREIALRVVNVSKYFGFFGPGVAAVKDMNLQANSGSILALLGHNGAGKTTLVNVLTGLTSASAGDAFIFGYSTKHDMDEIRAITGTCPQFDVYWPELTAREHLYIALGMKAKSTDNIDHEVDEKLHGVRLVKVANHQIQTYSGGMRRRLAVALSMVGNPKVIILDECTTGIDPANRRYIWKLIHSIKQDKLIILTTHSMEEADRLGDKIAIMNKGHLSAVGDSLHLKSKFSAGYRINFILDEDRIPTLQHHIGTMLPEAILTARNAGSLIYEIPDRTDEDKISKFFSFLQNSPERIARDWGVSNTTMEDVFLRVTQQQFH